MCASVGPDVQIKAAGGIRSLDDLLRVLALGVMRVGETATASILDEARARGIADTPTEVALVPIAEEPSGGY
jgi:deoxyribose-phosphate aldolase